MISSELEMRDRELIERGLVDPPGESATDHLLGRARALPDGAFLDLLTSLLVPARGGQLGVLRALPGWLGTGARERAEVLLALADEARDRVTRAGLTALDRAPGVTPCGT